MEAKLGRVRNNPPALYAFLLRMPKGADLHNHLSGAVYAESFLREAVSLGLCIDPEKLSYVAPENGTCKPNQLNAGQVDSDDDLANRMIDSLSMRAFVAGRESGHDHFFDTFDKFGPVSHATEGEAVAEVVERGAQQNESYLELMALTGGSRVVELGKQAGFDGDFKATKEKLFALGLEKDIPALQKRVDTLEHDRVTLLHCDTQPDSAPCRVKVNYIFQVLRNSPKESVFAQILAGFMLASADPRVVAVNLVQPEDYVYSMRDYHLHMQMVDYGKALYPKVHVSLHAGELALGLVPPEGLRFHIREAVMLGHAERIGHGVSIGYELDSADTLRRMKEQHVDVEVNLTSNDAILGVRGKDHPFLLYREAGVPITLSTDDEGVGRTHLTEEYRRAVESYELSYADLKAIVRNSLEFSFLPGESYWKSTSYQGPTAACARGAKSDTCQAFLNSNPKARAQADLEQRFATFETGN
jgi:adenosine deaminase